MSRVVDPDTTEYDEEEDERWAESESQVEWGEEEAEESELPPRPRNRLLHPLPMAMLAILIAAAGFLGGVLVQKGSGEEGSATGLPGGGELPSFLSGQGGEGSGSEGASGFPTALTGGSGNAVTGTVTGVEGGTIYVKDSDGSTVTVRAEDGSKISRNSNVGLKKIHPGDSVVVQGSKHGSNVNASSISATESGVETTGFDPSALLGGNGGGSVESLFGE